MAERTQLEVDKMRKRSKADTCIGAGAWSERHPQFEGVKQMAYPETITLMGRDEEIIVPHSELAMHMGIAGGKIKKLGISENGRVGCVVAEMPDGSCKTACGLTTEVIPVDFEKRVKGHFVRGK